MPSLDVGDYYWHQLIGMTVVSTFVDTDVELSNSSDSLVEPKPSNRGLQFEGVVLGKVKTMLETGANDVLVVSGFDGSLDERERLVPYIPGQYVLNVDIDLKIITVDWDPDF